MLDIKEKKGISVIFVILIVNVILGIAFGISSILMTQTTTLREIGYSVVAFYAADSGIEKVLLADEPYSSIPETNLGNGATFEVKVVYNDEVGCNPCIKSIGDYLGAKRAIEIMY